MKVGEPKIAWEMEGFSRKPKPFLFITFPRNWDMERVMEWALAREFDKGYTLSTREGETGYIVEINEL